MRNNSKVFLNKWGRRFKQTTKKYDRLASANAQHCTGVEADFPTFIIGQNAGFPVHSQHTF